MRAVSRLLIFVLLPQSCRGNPIAEERQWKNLPALVVAGEAKEAAVVAAIPPPPTVDTSDATFMQVYSDYQTYYDDAWVEEDADDEWWLDLLVQESWDGDGFDWKMSFDVIADSLGMMRSEESAADAEKDSESEVRDLLALQSGAAAEAAAAFATTTGGGGKEGFRTDVAGKCALWTPWSDAEIIRQMNLECPCTGTWGSRAEYMHACVEPTLYQWIDQGILDGEKALYFWYRSFKYENYLPNRCGPCGWTCPTYPLT